MGLGALCRSHLAGDSTHGPNEEVELCVRDQPQSPPVYRGLWSRLKCQSKERVSADMEAVANFGTIDRRGDLSFFSFLFTYPLAWCLGCVTPLLDHVYRTQVAPGRNACV